ncbi:hypothetical protein EC968_007208 [Mortierella alpina]|nr:hypothetical protein EC968_007208 [Mortierella alpina]
MVTQRTYKNENRFQPINAFLIKGSSSNAKPEIHSQCPAQNSDPTSFTMPTSPFDIPEIASVIASYISRSDLVRCARVSRSYHDMFIPFVWKTIDFFSLDVREEPDEEGHLMTPYQEGKLPFIEELTLTFQVSEEVAKMIAEHCTGLKVLNILTAIVSDESLAILIPGDRSQTADVDPDHQSNTRKTRFPTNLVSLIFKNCWEVAGPSCLEAVALLGPQLKRLYLDNFEDITDQAMINAVRRCPNLIDLRLNSITITDEFLKTMAQDFPPSDFISTPGLHRRPLGHLNLDWMSEVSNEGVIPVVMACRSTLKTLSLQDVRGVNDKLLFVLFEVLQNEKVTEGLKVALDLTTQVSALQLFDDKTPIMHHKFSPNTVLTEIRLSHCHDVTDVGFKTLFRYATELASISLEGTDVKDGALMVLAETYRNQMTALGLGVPTAWREHVLADARVQAMSREGGAAEGHQAITTAVINATKDSDTRLGRLRRLSLYGSYHITNKGVRAIVRSCVGLEFLDIGDCPGLSLGLFQGPWASLRLKDLSMSKMALEITPEDPEDLDGEDLDEDPDDEDPDFEEVDEIRGFYRALRAASYEEELVECSRFPLATAPYPQEDDFDGTGNYDHMALPLIYDYRGRQLGNAQKRNTPRQRAILRQFYSKLGELSQLQALNMSYCEFRVRIKDGLELVLPGLQQNLINWDLDLADGYNIENSELEFIGKHFGYGYDFADKKDCNQARLEGKTRPAKLQKLLLLERAYKHVSPEVATWLTITSKIRDEDMEMIVEHCIGLKVLHFVDAHVTAESLAVLISSDRNLTEDTDPDHQSKRRKIRFPSNLESLRSPTQTPLNRFKDITDHDMINVVRRCPNLVALKLKSTTISDRFFMTLALEFPPSDCTPTSRRYRQRLEALNLDLTKVSEEMILPVVMACRSTLKTLSVMHLEGVNDKLLFALVKGLNNETPTEGPKIVPDLTIQANPLENTNDKTPIMLHPFSPNTVLTEIRLSQSFGLTETGLQALFRFAIELVSIHLCTCNVEDNVLMVLAETYRTRMKALGLGVPAAWREQVLADEKVQAMARQKAAAGGHQGVCSAATSATEESMICDDNDAKVFTGGHVPGGLKSLSLRRCKFNTNKGVRAILRSCVGLELLNVGGSSGLTLELFQGPWASLRLKDLNISKMALEITPQHPEDLGDGHTFYRAKRAASYEEELAESVRFPLATVPYPQEDDFDERGNYDHMSMRVDDYDDHGNVVRRNNPRQRAILRQLYSKLGQLSQLQALNMSYCSFRVRVKDGLHLILSGLQENLTSWS